MTSFSRKCHICGPRKVTFSPIGMPTRSRKFEIALRDFVTTGRWPVIMARSFAAASIVFALPIDSPIPMFRTIFSIRGTCMTLP